MLLTIVGKLFLLMSKREAVIYCFVLQPCFAPYKLSHKSSFTLLFVTLFRSYVTQSKVKLSLCITLRCVSEVGYEVAKFADALRCKQKMWVGFPLGSLRFLIESILQALLWPWGRFGLQQKGGRCLGLTTLPSSCADCPEIPGASTS